MIFLRGLRWVVAKNTLYQAVLQGVSLVTGTILNMVLSRSLGVEGFGKYSYIFSFYVLFLSLNDFGINLITIREVSKNREKAGEILGTVLLFKLAVAFILIAIAWGVIFLMPLPEQLKLSLRIYSFVMPVLVLQLPLIVFQIDLKMMLPMVIGILNRIFQFFCVLWVLNHGGSLAWLMMALVGADAFFVPIYWFAVRGHTKIQIIFSPEIFKNVFKSSLPLGIAGVIGIFVNQTNGFFLERFSSLHEVGIYSAATRICSPFLLIPPMLMNTVYPLMSRYASGDILKLRKLYKECTFYLGAAGVALAVGLTLLSPWLIKIIFGDPFAESSKVLNVYIWSVAAVYLGITSGNFLITIGKEKTNVLILGAGAIVNTVFIMMFVPKMGALGAAWGSTMGFAAMITLSFIASERYFSGLAKKISPPTCIVMNTQDGRAQNLRNAIARQGWIVEDWQCLSWGQVSKDFFPLMGALKRASFVFASMNFPFQAPWFLLAQAMGVKVVLDCPVDVTESPFTSSWAWKKMVSFFCRKADYFLTLKSRAYMIDKFQIDPARVFYIENCSDYERIQQSLKTPPAFSLSDRALRIGYSGVADWHSPERFVPILKILKEKVPGIVWDVISDFEAPSMKRLVESCEREGLGDCLRKYPIIKPYERFISTADQFHLWISHLDNHSLLARHELRTELFEIGLLGKAVIAISTPAFEMHGFIDGENIIYIDPHDPAESAEKIISYLKAPEKTQKIGSELRRHIIENFSIDKSVAELLRFMKVNLA